VFLQNSKHGPSAKEACVEFLENAEHLVKVLKEWKCLVDDDLLDVVKLFEKVTT
jgi:hypothetical protein